MIGGDEGDHRPLPEHDDTSHTKAGAPSVRVDEHDGISYSKTPNPRRQGFT